MPEPAVQIEHLRHQYGQHVALDDVSLVVQPGEIFGFLGPNGSGKTTLFRILSTLVSPQQGNVRVLGLDLKAQRDAIRQRIGVVFQSPSLDKQLTAEENLRHHGHMYGLRGRDLQQRIDEMLVRLSLSDRRHDRVDKFSGGMRRRVELAKGLLHRPSILFLDEPSTGLDPVARIELWKALNDLRSTEGVTVLLTTHLMDEAEQCSRLAIMDRGRLVALDTPVALRGAVGGDVITLSSKDSAEVQSLLRQRLGIEAEIVDGTVRLERQNGHELVPQLIEAAPGKIESISVGKPTLQDVFVRLTGRRFSSES